MQSYNQQLIVPLGTGAEWCPPGVSLDRHCSTPLCNTWTTGLRAESARLLHHQAVRCNNTQEGRDTMQRDLDRLEMWNRIKLCKAKCKVCIQSTVFHSQVFHNVLAHSAWWLTLSQHSIHSYSSARISQTPDPSSKLLAPDCSYGSFCETCERIHPLKPRAMVAWVVFIRASG